MTARYTISIDTTLRRNRIERLFKRGMNTAQIADFIDFPESEVANELGRRRDHHIRLENRNKEAR